MILTVILRPDHMRDGRMSSCNEDPLALAIKEKLGDLYKSPRDIVAVGDDSVYLHFQGKAWEASYDIKGLYRTTDDKSRQVRLDFKPYVLIGS